MELLNGWEFIVASYVAATICGAIKLFRVSVKYKVSAKTLWRKLKPMVSTAFMTSNRNDIDHILGGKDDTYWYVIMKNGKVAESYIRKRIGGAWEIACGRRFCHSPFRNAGSQGFELPDRLARRALRVTKAPSFCHHVTMTTRSSWRQALRAE